MSDLIYRFRCLRPDHVDVYDEHVLASDYDALKAENAELHLQVESLQNKWASRPLSNPDLIAENERLRAALEGLESMYQRTWDRADGCLVMLPDNVERFEKAHAAARIALGCPLLGDDEDLPDNTTPQETKP